MKQKEMRDLTVPGYQFGSPLFQRLSAGRNYLFMGVLYAEQAPGVVFYQDEHIPAGLDENIRKAYIDAVKPVIHDALDIPGETAEDVYDRILAVRRRFGIHHQFASDADPAFGIHQGTVRDRLLCARHSVLIVMTRAYLDRLDSIMARCEGKEVYLLVKPAGSRDLIATEAELEAYRGRCTFVSDGSASAFPDFSGMGIDGTDLFIDVYGEEMLREVKDLNVPAVIETGNRWFYSKVLLNRYEHSCRSTVYVPAGMNIPKENPVIQPGSVTYHHLACLEKKYGDELSGKTSAELTALDPDLFVDFYGEGEPLSAGLSVPSSAEDYRRLRLAYIQARVRKDIGQGFEEYYLDDQGEPMSDLCLHPIRKADRFLVDMVELGPGTEVWLLHPEPGEGARSCLRRLNTGTVLVTNFLFFMTSRLIQLYNSLRKERPYEQIGRGPFGLDYVRENGEETFPLYRKAGLAMIRGHGPMLTSFTLRAGSAGIGDVTVSWEAADVNPGIPGAIAVYTPLSSATDSEDDTRFWSYVLPVGAGRINVAVIRHRVIAVRDGDILLPSAGVVLSLSKERADELGLLKRAEKLTDGYYRLPDTECRCRLENPSTLPDEIWKDCIWAYGGGITLMKDGSGDWHRFMQEEGWLTSLSRQTQESAIDRPTRHPRTFFAARPNGQIAAFVISGRTMISKGANYDEMLMIVRKRIPDAVTVMNVDGGASSVLAAAFDGHVAEISIPCPSTETPAGMIRNINTIFVIGKEGNI